METAASELQHLVGSGERFHGGTATSGSFLCPYQQLGCQQGPDFPRRVQGSYQEPWTLHLPWEDSCTTIPVGPCAGRWLLCDSMLHLL